MSLLNTSNPRALLYFLTETLFDVGMDLPLPSESVASHPAKPAVEISFFGGNEKNILFVVANQDDLFFSREAELAFLKTMNALNLDLNDVAVINLHKLDRPVFFERIRKKFLPKSCIFLGSEPAEAGLNAMAAHLWKEENGVRLLKSYAFEEMLTDKQKKRMFWDAIKLLKL